MVEIVEYGTDIKNDWVFVDGDLQIVNNNQNLSQAIHNRLNTLYNSLDLFYDDYGSFLLNYMGWRKTNETLNFIKMEITRVINNDARVSDFEVDVSFEDNGSVGIKIVVYYDEDYSFDLNYVLSETGVEVTE